MRDCLFQCYWICSRNVVSSGFIAWDFCSYVRHNHGVVLPGSTVHHNWLSWCLDSLQTSGLDSKLEKKTKPNEEAKKKDRENSEEALRRLHFWHHLALLQLFHRVNEEDHPCLVPFHLRNRTNKGLALAGGKALQKYCVKILIVLRLFDYFGTIWITSPWPADLVIQIIFQVL